MAVNPGLAGMQYKVPSDLWHLDREWGQVGWARGKEIPLFHCSLGGHTLKTSIKQVKSREPDLRGRLPTEVPY